MPRASGVRLPCLCLSRVATRVRIRSSPKPISAAACSGGAVEKHQPDGGREKQAAADAAPGRRIMVVVVDSSRESRCALHWALSHAVQVQDTLILLSVAGASEQGSGGSRRAAELLSMKNVCHARKRGVQVQVEVCPVEGEQRGPAVVEAARKQEASLLVLGQRKRSFTWRLLMRWAGRSASAGARCLVDYCIENAACMTLAVRRRSPRAGGYLITTRRHKDFWLLA